MLTFLKQLFTKRKPGLDQAVDEFLNLDFPTCQFYIGRKSRISGIWYTDESDECGKPVWEGEKYCGTHYDLKCSLCGERQATRLCNGFDQEEIRCALCDECEHENEYNDHYKIVIADIEKELEKYNNAPSDISSYKFRTIKQLEKSLQFYQEKLENNEEFIGMRSSL